MRGRLVHGSVDHPPWPLRRGRLLDFEDGLVAAAGLPAPVDEPLVHTWPTGCPSESDGCGVG